MGCSSSAVKGNEEEEEEQDRPMPPLSPSAGGAEGKTAGERAAEQYQQRLRDKAEAEAAAIRRIKIDEFDPIRPLDSFNITHRALLGRCWDRRRVELYPIVQLWHYVQHNFGSSPMLLAANSGGNATEGSSSSSSPPSTTTGVTPVSPLYLRHQRTQDFNSILFNSPTRPVGPSFSTVNVLTGEAETSSNAGNSSLGSGGDRIRRSSHWFSVSIVTTEYTTAAAASAAFAASAGINQDVALGLGYTASGSPVPFDDPLRNASIEDIYAAANAVEHVHKLTTEQREEIYSRFIMRMPRLAGGKETFAFRLGPDTSTEETTKFLRKRGLAPAKGVDIVRWNRVELLRPSLELISQSIARIQSVEATPALCGGMGIRGGGTNSTAGQGGGGGYDFPKSNAKGPRNLPAGDVNVSFSERPGEMDLSQPLAVPPFPTSPISAGGGGTGLVTSPSISAEALERHHSPSGHVTTGDLQETDYFPHDAVTCHAVGFSIDNVDGANQSGSSTNKSPHSRHNSRSRHTRSSSSCSSPLSPSPSGNSTATLALAVNCFSASVDPFHCESNGCLLHPIDMDDSKAEVVEQFGEGVITDVMYGGCMIVESNDNEGIAKLEDVLASMEWNKPQRLLSHVVHEVRERAQQKHWGGNPNMKFRILRRVGGRQIRDAVELDEIKVLLGEETAEEVVEPLSVPSAVHTTSGISGMGSSGLDAAFSRVTSAWMCLNTMVAALRTWVLHLLANPEYSQPISLYLQKFAGIATALQMSTVQLPGVGDPGLSTQTNNNGSMGIGSPQGTSYGNRSFASIEDSLTGGDSEGELAQVIQQIFEPEMNLEPYMEGLEEPQRSSHKSGGKSTHRRPHKLFTPRGASWVPRRVSSGSFIEILDKMASSTDTSSSMDSSAGQRKRKSGNRSAARALLRGSTHSAAALFYDPNASLTAPPDGFHLPKVMETRRNSTVHASAGAAPPAGSAGEAGAAWKMAMLELKALQTELQEVKDHHDLLKEEHEHAVYALDLLVKEFLPATPVRSLLPLLLHLNVSVRFPEELHGDLLQLTTRDWFPQLVAVMSSPCCHVRRIRVAVPVTAKDLPKIGMVAGLLRMGYAGRHLAALEFQADQLFSQGVNFTLAPPAPGSFRASSGVAAHFPVGSFRGGTHATSSNHGLPPDAPPYTVSPEQARDTLWVLLCACAEYYNANNVMSPPRKRNGGSAWRNRQTYGAPVTVPMTLRLRDFPRGVREGSFHSFTTSFFRSKTFRKMRLPPSNLSPPTAPSRGVSPYRAREGEGKTKAASCCGGDGEEAGGADEVEDDEALFARQGSVLFESNNKETLRSAAEQEKLLHSTESDPIIHEAVLRSARTALPSLPTATTTAPGATAPPQAPVKAVSGPQKEMYPFYSLQCHPCHCREGGGNAGSAMTLHGAAKPYRHPFNKVHNHERYACPPSLSGGHGAETLQAHHHIPPLPYFPPPDGSWASWEGSAMQSQFPSQNAPSPRGARAGTGPMVGGAKKTPTAADGPHWHFGFAKYEDEEADMKREEHHGYEEARDVWDSLEDAVKTFNLHYLRSATNSVGGDSSGGTEEKHLLILSMS